MACSVYLHLIFNHYRESSREHSQDNNFILRNYNCMHSGIIVGCLITLGDKLGDTVDKQTYESVNLM